MQYVLAIRHIRTGSKLLFLYEMEGNECPEKWQLREIAQLAFGAWAKRKKVARREWRSYTYSLFQVRGGTI